ncbi:hypothetical protein G6F70_000539 [Rhizopus microsporus]|nr:hypothetical protein G6F71_000113 [Rhizopus microsporus]KAG1204322.1 hypothetical protein G6F70_000539 [Rhizopus microsporus]KAG1215810.1 hypothetical protein G6F69_000709 [Rhizopus microsporus]KAG1238342.1 hypothetical protein G6F67_000535 [Rhizopus microsporus]KAG1265945.1 hypothetical protein G6F68_003170 [Rhizopus microsporus]
MKAAGINTNIYGPHILRSASSTKAFQLGTDIQKIKQHAHWSLETNTFERLYLKLPHQQADSTIINESIFSSLTENNTTSGVRLESTGIGVGMTSNAKVDERRTKDVVLSAPWYIRIFGYQ